MVRKRRWITSPAEISKKCFSADGPRACKDLLILDEPTRGVDVGAKVEIYKIIRDLANEGIGILLISSDLPEIIGMSDRIIVMSEGSITGELVENEIREEAIMHLATLSRSERT